MNIEHFTLKLQAAHVVSAGVRSIAQKAVSTLRQNPNETIQVTKSDFEELVKLTGLQVNKTWASNWLSLFNDQGERVDVAYTSSEPCKYHNFKTQSDGSARCKCGAVSPF